MSNDKLFNRIKWSTAMLTCILVGIVIGFFLLSTYTNWRLETPIAYTTDDYMCFARHSFMSSTDYAKTHEACHSLIYDDPEHWFIEHKHDFMIFAFEELEGE